MTSLHACIHTYIYTIIMSLNITLGTTPVYQAAQQGQLEALKFLCEKCKCKLTVASEDGAKPIHAAAQCGKTNIVQVYNLYYYLI